MFDHGPEIQTQLVANNRVLTNTFCDVFIVTTKKVPLQMPVIHQVGRLQQSGRSCYAVRNNFLSIWDMFQKLYLRVTGC